MFLVLKLNVVMLCVRFYIVMVSVIVLNVIMLSVVMLNVVMLSVVAPKSFITMSIFIVVIIAVTY